MKLYSRPALLLATLFLGGGLWSFLSRSSPNVNATSSLTRSDSLLKLAHQRQIDSQLEEAEGIYDNVLATIVPETEFQEGIQARIGLVEISIERGTYQDALKQVQELLSIGEIEGHQLLLAKILCTKGEAEIRYGDYVQADESINACQDIYTHISVGTLELEAYAEHLRGFLYHVQGYYMQALDHYQSSLKLKYRTVGGESTDYSNTLNNIGNVYTRLGDFNQALNYHNLTLQIRQKNLPADHPKIGGSFGNLGNVYDALGNTLAAIQHHEQAATIWKANFGEWHPDLGFSYDNLGQDFNKLSEYRKANAMYSNAIEIKRKVLNENHPSIATSLYGRGMALMGMGQVQLAQESVGEAIRIYEESHQSHHPKYFETLGLYSQILYKSGDQKASFDTFKVAIDLALKTNPRKAVSILNDFAIALLESNQLEQAIEYCHKAISINMNQGFDINAEFNPPIGSFYNIFEAIRSLVIKADALKARPGNLISVRNKKEVLETYERALEIAVYSRRLKVAPESKNDLNRDIDNLASGAISSALELFELTNDERMLDRIFRVVEFQKSGHFFDDLTDAQAKIIAHVPDSLKLQEIELRNQLAAFDRQLS
ncbi:tetratricopeptide repeat protein, partial [bacterium]|nr:tetratricopeptide repeat protein [bacterium]